MADPVLPGVIRVQAVLQGISSLPEDRYVTTWAFTSDVAGSDAGKAAAIDRVRNFYGTTSSYGGTIWSKLSGQTINEAASELRAYDLGEPVHQRVPYIEPFGVGALSSVDSMPSEVAVCLSYFAGLNRPGLRGRVYIGPLNTNAATSQPNQPCRVNDGIKGDIVAQADGLASVTSFPRWCIISRGFPTGAPQARIITNGWVDNAFDTVRKRGEVANNRTTFVAGA